MLQAPAPQVLVATLGRPLQLVVMPHAGPHVATALRFTSQPFAALPSQLPKPASHEVIPHAPAEHVVRFAFVNVVQFVCAPHVAPQVATALRFTSQPFAALPSQLPKPASQEVIPHAPAEHVVTFAFVNVLQFVCAPHVAPQVATALRFTSQPFAALPSQLPKPASQEVIPHAPAEHVVAFALVNAVQSTRPPQVAPHVVFALRLTSQPFAALPSQSANPGSQVVMPQAPAPQVALATLGSAVQSTRPKHAAPQDVTTLRFVSHPFAAFMSQLPVPIVHEVMPHAPLVHVATATFGAVVQFTRAPQDGPQDATEAGATSQPLAAIMSQSK
jgi:hypothetical protein